MAVVGSVKSAALIKTWQIFEISLKLPIMKIKYIKRKSIEVFVRSINLKSTVSKNIVVCGMFM